MREKMPIQYQNLIFRMGNKIVPQYKITSRLFGDFHEPFEIGTLLEYFWAHST
jgi:hypothetical protein